jgi:putative N6-adenine-specific DNA methylase
MAPDAAPPGRRRRPDRLAAVVVCLPGIEPLVAADLEGLGIRSRPAGAGALAARLTVRQLYEANVRLPTATRVLVEAGELTARTFASLEERVDAVDLDPYLDRSRPVRFRITSHRSKLHHTGAIEERLRRLLRLGAAPDGDPADPAQLVVVRVDRDRLTVRVDSSGPPLHHRGWRGPAGKAPLRETLAAAALAAVGWTPDQALVDPFAGSGTIPIEAARRAAGIAAGADRSFAVERWPSFAPGTWASVQAAVRADRADEGEAPVAPIVARDRDAGAVAAMTENATRAGVAPRVDVAEASVSALAAPDGPPGWIISNPPWGGRLAAGRTGDVRDVYARLGQVVADRFPGWGLALLVPDLRLAHAAGLRGDPLWRSRAGPTSVHLMARPPG